MCVVSPRYFNSSFIELLLGFMTIIRGLHLVSFSPSWFSFFLLRSWNNFVKVSFTWETFRIFASSYIGSSTTIPLRLPSLRSLLTNCFLASADRLLKSNIPQYFKFVGIRNFNTVSSPGLPTLHFPLLNFLNSSTFLYFKAGGFNLRPSTLIISLLIFNPKAFACGSSS